ncbi:hypothetical protein SBOR_5457 [Sclerotinia borealis F-4128]|uniref:Uncharacterized protein n=1 Tax=Sclerotinia borealis (strain F-4128) TaxID=1432307 RepID=W9CHG8_SCLBF|nr:hypothetical protein SBOR_5457 [Sclerotinia borealis F-4128]
MKFGSLALGLALVVGIIYAADIDVRQADVQLEGEFSREFGNGLLGRALTNLQIFTGSLGGVTADPITNSGDHSRSFMVEGDTFPAFTDAVSRSCANQNNKCADAANNPKEATKDLSLRDWDRGNGNGEVERDGSRAGPFINDDVMFIWGTTEERGEMRMGGDGMTFPFLYEVKGLRRRKANFSNNSASCKAAGASATQTNFQVLTSSNAEFDFICDS